jgi:hypothetical protein
MIRKYCSVAESPSPVASPKVRMPKGNGAAVGARHARP